MEKINERIENLRTELEEIPDYDFTGMEFETRAFGRVRIAHRHNDILYFEVNGTEKKFMLPDCIIKGFLVPCDVAVRNGYLRRLEIEKELSVLAKQNINEAAAEKAQQEKTAGMIREITGDLFEVGEDYFLAHCISADFSMSKGIVTEFDRRFGIGAALKAGYPKYRAVWQEEGRKSDCLLTGRVFNLVTKERYNYRPTYASVTGALEKMRDICKEQGIKKVAMPRIGSGLDRLKWDKVYGIIYGIFAGTGIEVLVCVPKEV